MSLNKVTLIGISGEEASTDDIIDVVIQNQIIFTKKG
ncbi:hypothetical protein FHS70_002721 [Flammeovirga yaeyamensis]|nr:hypothetical protein [Flammeovirga yaeyamensis]